MPETEPIRLTWEFTTEASVEETWELFSDTDRFNRSVGLNFTFEEAPAEDTTVRRIGKARFLGLNLSWDELPFQYRENQWYRTRRIFHSGPAQEYTVIFRVRDAGEAGTSIRYTVEVIPRNVLTRPVVALELKANTQPRLDRGLKGLLAELESHTGAIDPAPPMLDKQAARRLAEACERVEPAAVGRRLRAHVEEAPLYRQNQMNPLRLADEWGLDPAETLQGFLSAVHQGVLALRWDLLCPLCRAPKRRQEKLLAAQRVHCTSCNIYYDGTFPDSVAVSFRTAGGLRDFEVPIECIGSPSRQRHVIAQDTAAHNEGNLLELGVALKEGTYRVRTWPQRETAIVEVRPDVSPAALELVITPEALVPPRLTALPGQATLAVTNSSGRPVDVVLERVASSRDVLTAGRLLELPEARALLSPELVAPDFDVETDRYAVLAATGGRSVLRERLAAHGARLVHASERAVVALFYKSSHALRAAADLATDPAVRCAINAGPVMRVKVDGRHIPLGRTVEDALVALSAAHPCQPVLPVAAAGDPEVQGALGQEGVSVLPESFACTPDLRVHWLGFDGALLDA